MRLRQARDHVLEGVLRSRVAILFGTEAAGSRSRVQGGLCRQMS